MDPAANPLTGALLVARKLLISSFQPIPKPIRRGRRPGERLRLVAASELLTVANYRHSLPKAMLDT